MGKHWVIVVLAAASAGCFEPARWSLPPTPAASRTVLVALVPRPELSELGPDDRPTLYAYDSAIDRVDIVGFTEAVETIALFYYGASAEMLGLEIDPGSNLVRLGTDRPIPTAAYELIGPPFAAAERPPALFADLLPGFTPSDCANRDGCLYRREDRLTCASLCEPPAEVERPAPPMAPRFAPCPADWSPRVTANGVVCDPPERPRPVACTEGEIWRGDHCDPLVPCPADGWPPNLPAATTYVRAGATGGDGSRLLPLATIAEALASTNDTIALGPGTYRESLALQGGKRLVGACPTETRIESGKSASALSVQAGTTRIEGVNITQGVGQPAIFIWSKATLEVRDVEVATANGLAIQVAGLLRGRGLTVRPHPVEGDPDFAIYVEDAALDLDEVMLVGFHGRGIVAGRLGVVRVGSLVAIGRPDAVAIDAAATSSMSLDAAQIEGMIDLRSPEVSFVGMRLRSPALARPAIWMQEGAHLSMRESTIDAEHTAVSLSTGTLDLADVQVRTRRTNLPNPAIEACGRWNATLSRISVVGYRTGLDFRGQGSVAISDARVEAGQVDGSLMSFFGSEPDFSDPRLHKDCSAPGTLDVQIDRAVLLGPASLGMWLVSAQARIADISIADTTYYGARSELGVDPRSALPTLSAQRIHVERSCESALSFEDGQFDLQDLSATKTNHSCFDFGADNGLTRSHYAVDRIECLGAAGPGLIVFRPQSSAAIRNLWIDDVGNDHVRCEPTVHDREGEGLSLVSPEVSLERFRIGHTEVGVAEVALGVDTGSFLISLKDGLIESSTTGIRAIAGGAVIQGVDQLQFRGNKTGLVVLDN